MMRPQFEKLLENFDSICPPEMDKSKGSAFDKMLTVIRERVLY